MFLDSLDQLLSDFAPTTGSSNYSKYIDRLAKMDDGAGDPLYIYGLVTTTATGATNTTQFKILGNATDPTFASGNVTLADSGAIAVATLAAGYQFFRGNVIPRQPAGSRENTSAFYRYITCQVLIATADLTAGAFSVWVTRQPIQDNFSYPRGYSV